MPSPTTIAEFRSHWLPHVTDEGLSRLVSLLESASPLLIHGMFTRALPMGCLASHIAWNHPETKDLNEEAGVCWLTRVAGLNPATSAVILEWDQTGIYNWDLRIALLEACRAEQFTRESSNSHEPALFSAEPCCAH